MQLHPSSVRWVKGSFRDPDGRIFRYGDEVYRTLSPSALMRMRAFEKRKLLSNYHSQGLTIESKLCPAPLQMPEGDWVLQHAPIRLVTYPYEWSFEMLRDGAYATLSLNKAALDDNIILKDATAFNTAFHCGRMVHINTLSLTNYEVGQP